MVSRNGFFLVNQLVKFKNNLLFTYKTQKTKQKSKENILTNH